MNILSRWTWEHTHSLSLKFFYLFIFSPGFLGTVQYGPSLASWPFSSALLSHLPQQVPLPLAPLRAFVPSLTLFSYGSPLPVIRSDQPFLHLKQGPATLGTVAPLSYYLHIMGDALLLRDGLFIIPRTPHPGHKAL